MQEYNKQAIMIDEYLKIQSNDGYVMKRPNDSPKQGYEKSGTLGSGDSEA